MKKLLLFTSSLMIVAVLSAQVIHVPNDYSTIQQGIDAASSGDTVLVDIGTYYENINFNGKAITVASNFLIDGDTSHINNTIIDGSQTNSTSVVSFVTEEDTTSILVGFSITGGIIGTYNSNWDIYFGGGIACSDAGAKISNNKVFNNHISTDAYGSGGGGICCLMTITNPWVIIEDNNIYNNSSTCTNASGFGGGIYVSTNCRIAKNAIHDNACYGIGDTHASGGGLEIEALPGSPEIEFSVVDNLIYNNTIDGEYVYGAGISILRGRGVIFNNKIYNNHGTANDRCLGGGLRTLFATGKVIIENNIVYGNTLTGDRVQGGGIDVGGAEELVVLKNNQVYQNELSGTTASWGAGMCFVQDYDLEILNNEIRDNLISGGQWWGGAGVYNEGTHNSMYFINNRVLNNIGVGTSYGGALGIYDTDGSSYKIESNLFRGNYCNYGAGIWTFNTYDISMTNNIFAGNVAYMFGGAYALRQSLDDHPENISIARSCGENVEMKSTASSDLHPIVINNTFLNNTSNNLGGAIHSDQIGQHPIFINNIFWGNNASYADDIYIVGIDTLIISYCDINTLSDTNIVARWTGVENIYEDPIFCSVDSCHINGGPCHNTGINELTVDGITYYSPTIDYDGNARPQGDFWDIGADECLMVGIDLFEDPENSFQIYTSPNPTSSKTNIQFHLKERKEVRLSIMNMQGKQIQYVHPGMLDAGDHDLVANLSHLPDGIYLICLQAGNKVATTKVVLLK